MDSNNRGHITTKQNYKHFFDDAGERQGDERAGKDLPPILFRLAHFSFFLSFFLSTAPQLRDQTAGPTGMQAPPNWAGEDLRG
jgi:hypothetical protein